MRQLTSSKTFYVFAVIHGRKQEDKNGQEIKVLVLSPFIIGVIPFTEQRVLGFITA